MCLHVCVCLVLLLSGFSSAFHLLMVSVKCVWPCNREQKTRKQLKIINVILELPYPSHGICEKELKFLQQCHWT